MIILVAVVMVLFVREVHILVGIRKHTRVQVVHVVLALAHVVLVLPILEVTVQREALEQVVAVAVVVAIHVEVRLLHHGVIHRIDHPPVLPVQVAIQEVVEVAPQVVVVILAVLVAVAVLHVVAVAVVLHVVLVVAIEDSL